MLIGVVWSAMVCAGPGNDLVYKAMRTDEAPKIDGVLDDAVWLSAEVAADFIQINPDPGGEASQQTEVRMLYDNSAVYIAAYMYDVTGDSVMTQLSERDGYPNTDWFAVGFDTYNNDLNAFLFGVHATGVQWDGLHSDGWDDESWNAVWQSAVNIVEDGWVAEFKIPYSALRFPKEQVQEWGVNFSREVRRIRENTSWSYIDPNIPGNVNQWGTVVGIENIEAPVRLSFSPYASAYLEHYPYDMPGVDNWSASYNGGMDVKYGINEAFTIDMTLIPDFGQTKFDNQVLNLSPFEVRFNENRQFFTEGMEMFDEDLFYSRRVGSMPIGFWSVYSGLGDEETVVDNPTASQLINATKLSGRTESGLGIALFNGVTKPMYATIEDSDGGNRKVLTDPLTNYNVVVFDQQLKNNSAVRLTNTNVWREGTFYDANTTGLYFDLYDKNITWNLWGGGAASQLHNTGSEDDPEMGYNYYGGLDNVAGQWNYGVEFDVVTDKYDPNDLGFLYNNNTQSYSAYLSFNMYEPKGKLLNTWAGGNLYYERLYNPNEFVDFMISGYGGGVFRNFMAVGVNATVWPVIGYDYFEPRVAGRYYTLYGGVYGSAFISSNYAKKYALDINFGYGDFWKRERIAYDLNISNRWRVNDKLMIIINLARYDHYGDEGAAIDNWTYSGTIINEEIIFGRRDRITYENGLNITYTFNNKMGLSFIGRHYWSTVEYNSFHILEEDGSLSPSSYTGLDSYGESMHDISYTAFTIDMVYSWWFAPGSELRLVYKNLIETEEYQIDLDYFNNVNSTMSADQLNSFSIKALYYIDYLYFRKK